MRRGGWLSKGRTLVAASAAAIVALGLPAGPVAEAQEGNIIRVTTTVDGVANDNNCTLREAVLAANRNLAVDACPAGSPSADIIQLEPGKTYTLTRVGSGEDLGLTGDLDVFCPPLVSGAIGCDSEGVVEGADELIIEPVPPPAPPEGEPAPIGAAPNPPVIESLTGDRILHTLPIAYVSTAVVSTIFLLQPITIEGVVLKGGGVSGGAVFHQGRGTLTLENVTVTGNVAGTGAGIRNERSMTILGSTIYGNTAVSDGGGILTTGGTLSITNSTISANVSGADGAGVRQTGGTVTFANVTLADNTATGVGGGIAVTTATGVTLTTKDSIFAGNTALSGTGPDCFARPVSTGNNLIQNNSNCTPTASTGDLLSVDARLEPLAPNGGQTLTHAIAPDSPARDAGGTICQATDQRGAPRKPPCDIGAYELTVCLGEPANIFGTDGDDIIVGTSGNDVIQAFGGNDVVQAGTGNDTLCGGTGEDQLFGEGGNDILSSGGDDNELFGGDGDDVLVGGTGDNILDGGPGNDRLLGGDGDDLQLGGPGNDRLLGGHGDDEIFGERDDDLLAGGPGKDRLKGGDGNDELSGGVENDELFGEDGDDVLRGDAGNDILMGSPGNDGLIGGPGRDRCRQGPGTGLRRSCER